MNTNCKLLMILIFIFLLSSGCARDFKFVTTSIDIDHASYNLENVVLLLTPDYCDSLYTFEHLGIMQFHLGPTLCANSEKIVKQIFSGARIINGESVNARENASLIIKPILVYKSINYIHKIPRVASTLLGVKWEITNSKGELISKKTIRGSGRDEMYLGFSESGIFQSSVQLAIDNLFIESPKHLSSFIESDYNLALSSGKYGLLEKFIRIYNWTTYADLAQKELEKYEMYTVPESGEILWETDELLHDGNTDIVIEIKGELYSEPNFTSTSGMSEIFQMKFGAMKFGALNSRDNLLISEDSVRSFGFKSLSQPDSGKLSKFYYWYLLADEVGAYIEVLKGTVTLNTNREGKKLVESLGDTVLSERSPAYSGFLLGQGTERDKAWWAEYRPVIYVTEDEPFNGLAGWYSYSVLDKKKGAYRAFSTTTDHHDVVILGEARFSTDEWVPIKWNVEVNGGGIKFETDKITLLPGTKVAKKL